MLHSDSNVTINLETVSPQANRVLSSAKLYREVISVNKNKSLIERLNEIGPRIEPSGTPEIISLQSRKGLYIFTDCFRALRSE